jgi:ADP-heptose:LPS heptosyltransferase
MKTVNAGEPRKILVFAYGGIGDIFLATPLIASLRRAYPDASIDAVVQKGREGILEGNPALAAVHTTRYRHGVVSYAEFLLRFGCRYDLAVSTRRAFPARRTRSRKGFRLTCPRPRLQCCILFRGTGTSNGPSKGGGP